MKKISTYHAPSISYEIYEEGSGYHINAYIGNEKESDNPNMRVFIKNFCHDLETAKLFTEVVSCAAALPIHIEELADSFLSR